MGPAVLLLAALSMLAQPAPAAGVVAFEDRTEQAGIGILTTNGDPDRKYIIETLGSGAAMFDYDGDGDLDIYVVNGSLLEPIPAHRLPTGALYANDGRGRFVDVTEQAGLAHHYWGFGAATGDYDNDGDPDLYVTAWGPNRLFRNQGDGTFTDVASEAGLDDERFGTSAAFFDYDRDGDLDLYVVNYVTFDPEVIPRKGDPDSPCTFRGLSVMCGPHGLPGAVDALYRNEGDGTFTDVSVAAGLFTDGGYYGLGVTTADVNGDGLPDILVANDSTPNHYYMNLGDGRFSDEAMMAGFAYSNDGREQAGMGIDAADLDNDGDLDFLVTNFSHDYSTLSLNDGQGFLEDVSVRLGLVEPTVRSLGWGTLLFDFENDGDVDIFIANGHVYPEVEAADIGTTYRQRNQYFLNLENLRFEETLLPESGGHGPGDGDADLHRGAAAGDVDDDGDLDIVVTVLNGKPRLLVNTSRAGAWLMIRLVGHRSNRDGVGARVVVHADDRSWTQERRGGGSYLSASDPRLHFGLGATRRVDRVEVTWPSGVRQTVPGPALGRVLVIEEPATGGKAPVTGKSAPSKNDSLDPGTGG